MWAAPSCEGKLHARFDEGGSDSHGKLLSCYFNISSLWLSGSILLDNAKDQTLHHINCFTMDSQDKPKEVLIKELHELEQRVCELEARKTLRGQSHIGESVDTLHAGVVIHGKNGTEVIDCNTTALNILGVTREQLVGRNTFDLTWTFLLEDGSPMPVEGYPVSRVIATKKIVPNIIVGIKHDDKSEPIWIVCTAIPELDENDRIIQIVVSFRDISSLKKSEKQYLNLFENTMHEIHLWKLVRDEQGAIKTWQLVEANPTALKAWGKNRPDIIGKTADEVFLHNVTEQFMPIVKKIFSEGMPYTWEAYFPPTDAFLYMTSVPFGEYFMTTGTDITERKQMEEQLRASEESFRALVEQIPDTVQRLTPDGVHLYVNPLFAQMMGMTQADIIGKSNEEIGLPPDLIKQLDALREATYTSKRVVDLDFNFAVEGETRHLYTRLVPELDEQGNVVSLLGITRDITERKQMEDALRKSETELRELNDQKDKFFSIIAHDLRNPFNSIRGLSTLLTDQIKEKDYEAVGEYAMLIEQSSEKALDLLKSLMDWSLAQTGRMDFNPETFELTGLIKDNKMLLDIIADQKGITIKKNLPHELTVYADKPMINTVLRNLISNALKFTRQDGEITISAEKRSKEILISVIDNGIGIVPDRLEKLFRLAESSSTSGTNNEKGTGLGLILCKEFVENHGGKIWAESEQEKGSAFYFTLPCDAS